MNDYLGTIGFFAFNFAPKYWAFCSGSLLSIAQNSALFSLLGTTYGGNGIQTFGLPDLRSRTPLGYSTTTQNYPLGTMAGVENVTLSTPQLPAHTHPFSASNAVGNSVKMDAHLLAQDGSVATPVTNSPAFGNAAQLVVLNNGSVSNAGGNASHINIQPCLAINFCIAVSGIYPSRN